MLTIILVIVIVILAIIYKRATRHYGYLESLGIPVIKPYLCFGSTPLNYHEIAFHNLDLEWYHKLGKPKVWGWYEGSLPTIATMDPSMLKAIIVKEFDSFRLRGHPSQFVVDDKYYTLDLSSGDKWKHLRKFLSPTFTSGKLKGMVAPIELQADKFITHLQAKVEAAAGDSNR